MNMIQALRTGNIFFSVCRGDSMARLTFTGAEEFAQKLLALGAKGEDIQKAALYAGAGEIASAIKAAVQTIPSNIVMPKPYYGLLPEDKEDMASSVGIAKFESKSGEVTTAVSFSGYARRKEKKYPKGVPIALLARSLESGSSNRQKYPFVRKAINAAKKAATEAMQKAAEDKYKEIMKGG